MSKDHLIVRIDFQPTFSQMADAMAIEARDNLMGEMTMEKRTEREVTYVEGMNKADAMKALRECFYSYGSLSWPEDIPSKARQAALARVKEWYGA